eukprot:scaffold8177_cov106-Cylindrotheca_fusiformis.AAC.10
MVYISLLSQERLLMGPSSPDFSQALDQNNAFIHILGQLEYSQHPFAATILSYGIVTAADMVPFLPCQPLAIALGAQLGFRLAFPITTLGQTTAGILAFSAARKAANSDLANDMATTKLSPKALEKLQEFRSMTDAGEQGDVRILLALIGLRLAPFFPFSAGNYLLGGTTSVPLRLFIVATLLGCIASNLLSVSIGAGGAMVFFSSVDDGMLAHL